MESATCDLQMMTKLKFILLCMLKSSFQNKLLECGCDEAGRGCLAGPVYAAAVILPRRFKHEDLDDSKKLTAAKREELRQIIEREALAYAVYAVTPRKIEQINILNASFLAMTNAVKKLNVKPELLLIDGNRFRSNIRTPHECIIKGDSKFLSIAAASILAKTYRDDFMKKVDKKHPQYNWKQNKGYPTQEHRSAIMEYGTTKHHRKTFKLLPDQLELDLNH